MSAPVRAVICDVYHTLLTVGPAPADAEERWAALCRAELGEAGPTLAATSARCREVVALDHREAIARGVTHPEVLWEAVMTRALPGLAAFPPERLGRFLVEHAACLRTTALAPGAAAFLTACRDAGVLLGIASNAQRYTLAEGAAALGSARLSWGIFDPALVVWSWELGFSKPSPHFFRILDARLRARGIAPAQVLMVGDRLDNDIAPAAACGWQTLHLAPRAGTWADARERVTTSRGIPDSAF